MLRVIILASVITIVTGSCYNLNNHNFQLKEGDYAYGLRQAFTTATTKCNNVNGEIVNLQTKDKIDEAVDCVSRGKDTSQLMWTGGRYVNGERQWSDGEDITGPWCHWGKTTATKSEQSRYVVALAYNNSETCFVLKLRNTAVLNVVCEAKNAE